MLTDTAGGTPLQLRAGDRFEHAHLLDTAWKPGPGERYSDAPHAICRVTAIRRGRVYYAVEDEERAHAYFPADAIGSHVARILPHYGKPDV